MSLSQQDLIDANKAAIDALVSISTTVFEGSERLLTLNLSTARSFVEDSLSHGKSLSGVRDLNELLSINAAHSQPFVDKALTYSHRLYEISAQTQEQLAKLGEAYQSRFNKLSSTLLDNVSKSAPSGSDVAVAAFKSAISAANSAFDNASRAAKHVASITEASVAAATNATVRAANATSSAANAAVKKKAA